MRTLGIVALVALAQVAVSVALIRTVTGDGSFVGLGILLLAIPGIPATALVNTLIVRAARTNPKARWARHVVWVGLILPAAQWALLMLVPLFRL